MFVLYFLYLFSMFFTLFFFFFFNDTATTEIYTLSLHDALPIWPRRCDFRKTNAFAGAHIECTTQPDRKSTRLNSSHRTISYAVFCLKKKKKKEKQKYTTKISEDNYA